MTTPLTIDFVSDIACPWCAVGLGALEQALKRLEEESRKPVAERKAPEFGSDKDFQLMQAIRQLKGQSVLVSKTLVERKPETKEE